MTGKQLHALGVLVAILAAGATPGWASSWSEVRQIDGVTVESRATASGFNEHRGKVRVCTDLSVLEAFVADTDRFSEWLPYTRDAELLEASEQHYIYYVRSTTPWPLKDRDMVYEISRQPDSGRAVTLDIVGLPDYQLANQGVIRIQEATGQWRFMQSDSGLDVSYQLFVNPGPVPPFLANGRLASAVGKTLANLAARFSCAQN